MQTWNKLLLPRTLRRSRIESKIACVAILERSAFAEVAVGTVPDGHTVQSVASGISRGDRLETRGSKGKSRIAPPHRFYDAFWYKGSIRRIGPISS